MIFDRSGYERLTKEILLGIYSFQYTKKSKVCKKIVRDQQEKFIWIKAYNWQENYF
jgi:hypothetical protein